MRNVDGGCRVALHVGQQLINRCLVDKASNNKARVAEKNRNINILGCCDNFFHVVHTGGKVNTNGTKLLFGVCFTNLVHGRFQKFVVEGDNHNIQALTRQFESDSFSDSASSPSDESPCRIVFLLEIGNKSGYHPKLWNEIGDQPKDCWEGKYQCHRHHYW